MSQEYELYKLDLRELHKTEPFNKFNWVERSVKVQNVDGSVVFEAEKVLVPDTWSQTATEILASKYFRKDGVPRILTVDPERLDSKFPLFLSPHIPHPDNTDIGGETSAAQVVCRLAGHWTYTGIMKGYFNSQKEAEEFFDNAVVSLLSQTAAPNSPQWFNTGLWWFYGIKGDDQGQWIAEDTIVDGKQVITTKQAENSYEYPQVSACYIQNLEDNLLGKDGIYELINKEARVFKYGSGSGVNVSKLREKNAPLSSGGKSSGLMSFLKVLDKSAGAIKSGGTTRRAACLRVLNIDHPDIEEYIWWKVREEAKVKAMADGVKLTKNKRWKEVMAKLDMAERLTTDFNSEAYDTVSGQNANNSVRLTADFMHSLLYAPKGSKEALYGLTSRVTGKVVAEKDVHDIWEQICEAAWQSADPGVQYDDNVNEWNTAINDDRIYATNPCSEFNFLDNTSCNLASINLCKFLKDDGTFNYDDFCKQVELWTTILNISVDMASSPSQKIAEQTARYRTIGLGYANLGSLLMRLGIPYDSLAGLLLCSLITSLLQSVSYLQSYNLSNILNRKWEGLDRNREVVKDVIEKHAYLSGAIVSDKLKTFCGIIPSEKALKNAFGNNNKFYKMVQDMFDLSVNNWVDLTEKPENNNHMNSQLTVIAPTGTIGLLMDCDTTGIEPEFSLIKYKKLSGGGVMQFVNGAVPSALKTLGYEDYQVKEILDYISEPVEKQEGVPEKYWKRRGHVVGAPYLKEEHYPVFDCAVDAGGGRYIHADAHIDMMGAAQNFISGAISKTINLPAYATVADISDAYIRAYKDGVKCVAVYRDGSKLSQPLNSSMSEEEEALEEVVEVVADSIKGKEATRRHLPDTRTAINHKFLVANHEGYINVGLYEDGKPGELFITMSKEGSTIAGLMNALGTAISVALQYGVPLEKLVDKFSNQRFEPAGMTSNKHIPIAKSLVDYIFKWLGITFIPGYKELISPVSSLKQEEPTPKPKVEKKALTKEEEAFLEREKLKQQLAEINCESCGDTPLIE